MFIVIETFSNARTAAIITEPDGMNKVFNNRKDAEAEALQCQDGIVLGLGPCCEEEFLR